MRRNMVNYEIDAVDVMSDILERNPGTDFRISYWKPDHLLKITLFQYEKRINVAKLVDKDKYKFIPEILLEMEKEYREFKERSDTN